MNARERYLATLTFQQPDRIPFEPGHGRESTRKRWHAEGLPADRNPVDYVREVLGIDPVDPVERPLGLGADFRLIPQFEEQVLEHRNGHYVVQDWKGNVCEISDQFDVTYLRTASDFVTRRWIKCPVETHADWEAIKPRYDLDAPGRFPADFAERCRRAQDRQGVLRVGFSGPFWQLREWCGFEGLCMLMLDDPEFVAEMAAFWKNFVSQMLARILDRVVPDVIGINEDMAYKGKSMISMDMVRRFCLPSWTDWVNQVQAAGCPLVDLDSDGYVGELIPLWIEAGVNVCDPIEVAAGCDLPTFRAQFGHKMAYTMGVDKRCIAAGGQALRDELSRLEPVIRDGGYIPGCDHGVPHDVSWADFLEYSRQLAELTGWL
ncbi:MAG: hypothetical protein K9N49_10320 [Candidatus Marinimicrobia bacterium]|nr:hypothetical protein [Candidatus Neomarinimicrobiota bacterium]